MLDFVQFSPDNFNNFEYNGIESDLYSTDTVKKIVMFYISIGEVMTIKVNGNTEGFIGLIYHIDSGFACFWSFLNKHALIYIKGIISFLNKEIIRRNLKKIAIMTPNNKKATRLAEFMGFKLVSYIYNFMGTNRKFNVYNLERT